MKSKSKPGSAHGKADKGAAAAQTGDKDLMSVAALVIIDSECQSYKGLYIRLISEWADCCTNSKVYGEGLDVAWANYRGKNATISANQPEPEPAPTGKNAPVVPVAPFLHTNFKTKSATYKWPAFTVSLDDMERRKKFQNTPGMYAVLMGKKNGETRDTILSFAYADCSVFAVEPGHVSARSQSVEGVIFELSVCVGKAFLSKEDILVNEPMFLNIERYKL